MATESDLTVYTCQRCDAKAVGSPPSCDQCVSDPDAGATPPTRSAWRWARRASLVAVGAVLGWVAAVAGTATNDQRVLGDDALNTAFMTMISQEVAVRDARLFLANWVRTSDSTVYFEMAPPSGAMPTVAWEVIGDAERKGVMEFFAIAYDRFVLQNNQSPMTDSTKFRQIGLKYLGIDMPLALRRANGTVDVFRSPYAKP